MLMSDACQDVDTCLIQKFFLGGTRQLSAMQACVCVLPGDARPYTASLRGFGSATQRMNWLKMLFAWWSGATWGTMLSTWFRGQYVASDMFGNRYYQDPKGLRRWVIYNGTVEASRVPPEWHGWLHHTFKEPPTVALRRTKSWEKESQPNLTGTSRAYRPEGSLSGRAERAPSSADYEAWVPE